MLFALLMLALPQDALLAETSMFDATEVAERLDVTSFPNSIGPRREADKHRFADYGFTEIADDAGTAELTSADGEWVFRIRVLGASGDTIRICVLDRALNGGSYFTVKPVEISEGDDGLFHATGREITSPDCQ
ncbi:MAG: hypothetical protein CMN73_07925 [Sphingomonas sp.]|nr:hypothetical protein [Sphingomonas sp.]|tara:strand:+ start:825 stop:1223 length:399 start_codon:yes stop_codon:yes gene_type:complete